jgi:hypothetical protein
MRKALKAATLMGLAAALVVPAAPAKAADMEMGSTKISIGGQLRERVEWYASEVGTGVGKEVVGSYRARLKIKAELADGVTAVFTPQAVGYWGENGQGLGLDSGKTNVFMHEAYMLLANAFGVDGLIIKMGRQEVNLGNQRLVGAVGWSQGARSLDGVLLGYSAGDYGLAGFFYGKLNDEAKLGAWATPESPEPDIELFVSTWQGKFKPFGIGGTYEITNIYVNPTTYALDVNGDGEIDKVDMNVNTLYGRVTPVFDTDYAKVKLNLEAAMQTGSAGDKDFGGYFFSVGAGGSFEDVTWTPDVFIGYDYSGDDDPNDKDLDAFWSVLPTAHKWLGYADKVFGAPFYAFNGAGLIAVINQNVVGAQDFYIKFGVKPMDKISAHLDLHYFKSAEDYETTTADGKKVSDDSIGWEADFALNYKYSRNLCLTFGYDYFDPDDAYVYAKNLEGDDPEHHIWFQADLKF